MNGIDIISPTKPLNETTFPNGVEVLMHDVKAFSNLYSTGESFDELAEKTVDENTEAGIHFSIHFKLHPDAVKKLDTVGQQIKSICAIVQHNLVMYSFAYSIDVFEECEEKGLLCRVQLVPDSYTFCYSTEMRKGGVPIAFKPSAPELKQVKWTVDDEHFFDLCVQSDGVYSSDTLVALDSLRAVTNNAVATFKVEMTIDPEYFTLGDLVNLNVKEAYVAPNSFKVLDKILAGEVAPKSDWVMTVNEGFPSSFHVHGPVLADASLILRAAVVNHMSIGPSVAMISHENRLIFTNLSSKDMRVILTYIYHRRYVLPEFDSVHRIGKILALLFRDEIPKFFESWEAQIIKHLMQLDRSASLQTVAECVKALIRVVSAPHGALLAAYNVALIVAADACQMAEANGCRVSEEQVKKEVGESWELIDNLMDLIDGFKISVCGVEKTKYVRQSDT